jgi:[acyl-carrier-protein] S-malonyltransferase
MFEGPEGDITLTENAQPALMAVSVAVLRVLESEGKLELGQAAAFVAGHSLGEYSALTAARAIQLADAARLLKRRGLAMQRAVPVGVGAMAALMGMDMEPVKAIAKEAEEGPEGREVCDTANDNAPGQVVVSGHAAAVGRAVELAKTKAGKRGIMLPVSAPFHCALMQPAADEMAEALASTTIMPPQVPLVANVSAQAESDPETIRKLLVTQVTSTVRWRECVLYMKGQGVDTLVELGSGKVLGTLVKRIDKEMTGVSVGAPADIEALLKTV